MSAVLALAQIRIVSLSHADRVGVRVISEGVGPYPMILGNGQQIASVIRRASIGT